MLDNTKEYRSKRHAARSWPWPVHGLSRRSRPGRRHRRHDDTLHGRAVRLLSEHGVVVRDGVGGGGGEGGGGGTGLIEQ